MNESEKRIINEIRNRVNLAPSCDGHVALRSMNLSSIPPEAIEYILDNSKVIRNLYLYNNRLTTFPVELCNLNNLEVLNLDNNQLTALPPQIKNLRRLRYLSIENNNIYELPLEIADLPLLQQLKISNNPLPESILTTSARGVDNLRIYLRSLQEGAIELYEVKILFVGEGGVGKTSLIGALRGDEFIENRDTTHGIEIKHFDLKHPKLTNKSIHFNAWDFGGQEVYRISHQFFYSSRALYLVLWSPRVGSDQSHVEEWLEQIMLRVGTGARVVVIATSVESCDRLSRIDKTFLREKFKGIIVDFVEIDSKTEYGINRLKELLSNTAAELPQMGDLLSISWKEARAKLSQRAVPYLSYMKFSETLINAGGKATEVKAFAELLHDLGDIVYFGDDEGLEDTVVLQPEWLTKAIGYVLEDKTTDLNSGVLQHNRLRELWFENVRPNEPRYDPSLHPFFLRLMEKFDISYRLEGGDASLVAQLVPYDRPIHLWASPQKDKKDISELSIVCRMSYSPPGLVPWLIVRSNRFAPIKWKHWRKGTYLEYKNHGAAILELTELTLRIIVRAIWPAYFMDLLRFTLETLISERWPGLTYSFSVPCPSTKGNGQRCIGHFPLETLYALRNRIPGNKMPCIECATQFDIDMLLSGFSSFEKQNDVEEIKKDLRKLRSYGAMMYEHLLRAITDDSKVCPSTFTLIPVKRKYADVGKAFNDKFRLNLWCEMPDHQHPTCKIGTGGLGEYIFTRNKEWFKEALPYVTKLVKALRFVMPFADDVAENLESSDYATHLLEDIKETIDFLDDATAHFSEEEKKKNHGKPLAIIDENVGVAEGAALRRFEQLLIDLDPSRGWGNLRKVFTPTYGYLWLCPDHYREYDPGLPKL